MHNGWYLSTSNYTTLKTNKGHPCRLGVVKKDSIYTLSFILAARSVLLSISIKWFKVLKRCISSWINVSIWSFSSVSIKLFHLSLLIWALIKMSQKVPLFVFRWNRQPQANILQKMTLRKQVQFMILCKQRTSVCAEPEVWRPLGAFFF